MTRVIVVNHAHSVVCGIHDLGKRMYGCLMRSNDLAVEYAECSTAEEYLSLAAHEPDAVIINHRDDLTPWAGPLRSVPVFAVLHQYEEATADARADDLLRRFHRVLVLDPGLHPSDYRVHAVGRPIPERIPGERTGFRVAQIGSFGFAFPHKGFAAVAGEINDQCVAAVFNLHMPEAYFNGASGGSLYTPGILADIGDQITGPGVEVRYTSDHLGERELIARLAQNDVNCLFYTPGQPDAGLSSAVDYLIAARRPMLLSGCAMFRHAWNAPIWPDTRLGDILDNYDHFQQEANVLYDSMAGRFVRDIEKIVAEL